MEKTDIAIIGAGVVGLAAASRIGRRGRNVVVIEKHPAFGRETSSRNSEVIHSGLYYPGDFLKTKLCVQGNKLLYQLCEQQNINHRKTGKLVNAVDNAELEEVEKLFAHGRDNGLEGLVLLTENQAKEREPHIQTRGALYVPSTGIIDTHRLMSYLEFSAQSKGVTFAYNCEVTGIGKKSGYEIKIKDADGQEMILGSQVVINCAGLYSDRIAQMAGIDIDKAGYRLHYCKGEYFRVAGGKARFINHLVYPVPKKESLGVHTVIDLKGQLKLGPNAYFIDEIDYNVDSSHKLEMYNSAKKYLPFIAFDDLSPDMAGIRPKLQGPGEAIKDFVICSEEDRGLPGFINLIGIESPGLTASLAIAMYIEQTLK